MRRCTGLLGATLLVAVTVLGSLTAPTAQAQEAKERAKLEGHTLNILGLAFTPNGKMLISCAGARKKAGEVKVWDVTNGKEKAGSEHKLAILCVAAAADGKTYSMGMDGHHALSLWDVGKATVTKRLDAASFFSPVMSMAFSADGRSFAVGSTGDVEVWDVASTKKRWSNRIGGLDGEIPGLSWSRDGKTLAVANVDKEIPLLDAATGKKLAGLTGHEKAVIAVAFSPDGKTLASGSADKTIKLWDVTTRKNLRTLAGHNDLVLGVAFFPDGKTLASVGLDGNVRLWNVATGKELAVIEKDGINPRVLAVSPDGKTVAIACNKDKTIVLYDVEAITRPKK